MLSTSEKMPMTSKGVDTVAISNFTKYGFCSNNETRFIFISQMEERFWVIKVPVLSVEQKQNVDFLKMLREEIPAFLYFLNNRKIQAAQKTRMWFAPETLITNALKRLREQQKPKSQKILEEKISEMFQDMGFDEMYYTVDNLVEYFPVLKKYEGSLDFILKENLKLEKWKDKNDKFATTRYSVYSYVKEHNGEDTEYNLHEFKHIGRPFVFKREKFIINEK